MAHDVHILLTNDDGFDAPGLVVLRRALAELGEISLVAPEVEQSGMAHSITYLRPLFVHEVTHDGRHGWVVNGTPADCVKLAVTQLCQPRPDLVVSGINHGLNAGINVLYSGTVAAAVEGAFFGIPSMAISLEYDDDPSWNAASQIARQLIRELVEAKPAGNRCPLFNINIPTSATEMPTEARVVPMGHQPYGEEFVRRLDPRGRAYFWATGEPPPQPTDYYSDLSALDEGYVSVTPLTFDLTHYKTVDSMQDWKLSVG